MYAQLNFLRVQCKSPLPLAPHNTSPLFEKYCAKLTSTHSPQSLPELKLSITFSFLAFVFMVKRKLCYFSRYLIPPCSWSIFLNICKRPEALWHRCDEWLPGEGAGWWWMAVAYANGLLFLSLVPVVTSGTVNAFCCISFSQPQKFRVRKWKRE